MQSICEEASNRITGYGLEDGVQMGPVINHQSKKRIENSHQKRARGAELAVDGRNPKIQGYEKGSFIGLLLLQC